MNRKRYRKGQKIVMRHVTRDGNQHINKTRTYRFEKEYPYFILLSYPTVSGVRLHTCFTRKEIEDQTIN